MQRWTAYLFAALFAGSIGLVFWKGRAAEAPAESPFLALDAGVEADAAAAPTAAAEDAGAASDEALPDVPGVDAGGTLLSGEAAPALAGDAPKSVVFGVVLVQYRGTQGAPATAPTREVALERAMALATEAKADFKAAVAKGDKGSMENAGRMPRGILEPAPEYVLFSLPKGGVSDPVDTPRGFWIAHRIE